METLLKTAILVVTLCFIFFQGPSWQAGHELCNNGGDIIKLTNGFQCTCFSGFNGTFCSINIDDCVAGACVHGNCSDGVNNFTCACDPGWKGQICDIEIDECESSPCSRGNCTDKVNAFECVCDPGYIGETCNTYALCVPGPCIHGVCSDDNNGWYNCACHSGYTGENCTEEINECDSNPCQNGGTCTDHLDKFTCACPDGYNGYRCQNNINECWSSPCQHGGTCLDGINGYNCSCQNGSEGIHCETDINECAPAPCDHGICMDRFNGYQCECYAGYTSTDCDVEIDECASGPCQHDGNCTDILNGYTCSCTQEYEGTHCETYYLCDPHPCNYGTCHENGTDAFSCICNPGYTGTNCSIDIDECASSPCVHGTCEDKVNRYKCHCETGYTGAECQTEIDECAPTPCQFGGTCTDMIGRYNCTCQYGFTGDNCETAMPCGPENCENGATCSGLMSNFVCHCREGFLGQKCENCGGSFASASGTFTQPDYVTGSTDTYNCSWYIAAGVGSVVELTVNISRPNGSLNDYDTVGIFKFQPLLGYSSVGSYQDGDIFYVSPDQSVRLDFLSDLSVSGPLTFIAKYEAKVVPASTVCGGRISGTSGILQTPAYPASYLYDLSCSWLITGIVCSQSSRPMILKYKSLNLDSSDAMNIYALEADRSNLLLKIDFSEAANGELTSNESNVLVQFDSKRSGVSKTFMLEFSTQDDCDTELDDLKINHRLTSKFKRRYYTVGKDKHFYSRLAIGLVFTLPILFGYLGIIINDARTYQHHLTKGIEYKQKIKGPKKTTGQKKKEEEVERMNWFQHEHFVSDL